jgi:hypothetical protein
MTVILGGKPLRAQDPAYRPSLALFFVFRRFLPSHNPRYKPRGESRGSRRRCSGSDGDTDLKELMEDTTQLALLRSSGPWWTARGSCGRS